jgi:hypothetical protein
MGNCADDYEGEKKRSRKIRKMRRRRMSKKYS